VGLALAQLVAPDPSLRALGAAPIAVIGLVAARPREGEAAAFAWLVVVGLVAALGGLLAGGARVHSIDDGALLTHPGQPATVDGFVAGVPRRNGGEVDVRVDSAGGRVLVVAPEPVGDLRVGSEVRAEGALETPEPWRAGYLSRQGIAMTLTGSTGCPGAAAGSKDGSTESGSVPRWRWGAACPSANRHWRAASSLARTTG
jgi:hypothetical protein